MCGDNPCATPWMSGSGSQLVILQRCYKPSAKTKQYDSSHHPLLHHPLVFVLLVGILLLVNPVFGYSIVPKVQPRLGETYQEPVFYEPSELLELHTRRKRDISEPLRFTLHAKSRDFHLVLQPDTDLFSPHLEIESASGTKSSYSPVGYTFQGHLEDEPGTSRVEGLITSSGHFDGVISTSDDEIFHIEPAHRYVDGNNKHLTGWSPAGVLYDSSTIEQPILSPSSSCLSSHPNPPPLPSTNRTRRAITLDPRRTTCMLYLQADHLFLAHLGSEEKAISMMTRHIQRVNEIYRATDFDGDGLPDGISFMIKRIKVHNSSSASPYTGDFQVIKFLEKFSEGDYESFCLAYMFTFRDFDGGTLGLAWTGDLKNAGGVCERKGHFRGGLKSLNTGIITLLNYGKVVLPAVSYVTLAHEIGHNFGSPHDPENEKECVPGGRDGNFIMYARATAGDQRNNQRFSPCSLRSIRPVLATKARNTHGCFTEPQRGICGNREVEPGEECDCGWEEDCTESCCYPNRLNPPPSETPCTLKPTSACSPSQGPCCTSACTLTKDNPCRSDNGCRHTSTCSGLTALCPPSVHKPNKTVCGDGSAVCFMGECTGSICLAYGLVFCQCSPAPWDSSSKVCELCCKQPGESSPCLSSFELNSVPYDVPDLYSKPGSPCKNYTGYCDAYRTCREVDPSGPLATLRNLLLADEGLSAIAAWVDAHWYAVVSFVILLIIMMVLTAKLCGKQAKKKLRKITILHSNVDAIQIERSYWDEGGEEHVVHPAAVRKKIPLRKKIREKKKGHKSGRRGSSHPIAPTTGGQQLPSPTSETPPDRNKENNTKIGGGGARYGTLWRKRRAAERSRVSGPSSSKQKTVASSSSSPSGSKPSSSSSSNVPQCFDLVQLNTPPSLKSGEKMIYPNLLTPNKSNTGEEEVNKTSTSSAPSSKPAPVNKSEHEYEAKTAILPSGRGGVGVGGRGGGGARRKQKKSGLGSMKGASKHISKTPSTAILPKKGPTIPTTSSKNRAPRKNLKQPSSRQHASTSTTPKTTMQIVYTPPFSIKVVHVPLSDNNFATTTINQQATPPAPQQGSSIQQMPLPTAPPPQLDNMVNPSNSGPPPYTDIAQGERPHSSSTKAGKASSGSSIIKKSRGRIIRKEKGELRVLIPPPNLMDDDAETPTPGT